MQASKATDGGFVVAPGGMYRWEIRRVLLKAAPESGVAKVQLDGPCQVMGAYASVSPIEQAGVYPATVDDVLVELKINKDQQLSDNADEIRGGQNDPNMNAATLGAFSSKDNASLLAFDLPEGKHELTAIFKWKGGQSVANTVFGDVICALTLVVNPGGKSLQAGG